MQSVRSLPVRRDSVSFMGITVSRAQAQYSVPDRPDLDLEAIIFENYAVVVAGLRMDDLAEVQGGHSL